MAQAVKNGFGCGECSDGEITLFFAHHSEKRLREDYVYCQVCRPDGKATAGPRAGEEQITTEQYYEYLQAGWRETDPV